MTKDPEKMKEMADKMQKRVEEGQKQLKLLEESAAKEKAEKKAAEGGEDKKPAAESDVKPAAESDEKPAAK